MVAAVAAVAALLFAGTNVVLYNQWRASESSAARQQAVLADRAAKERSAAERSAGLVRLLARPDVRTTTLTSPEGTTSGTVLVDGVTVHVLTDGLAVNDRSRTTYVLWRFADDRSVSSIGAFDVASGQVALVRVGELPAEGTVVSEFAVSLEQGRRAPREPTELLASADVGQ